MRSCSRLWQAGLLDSRKEVPQKLTPRKTYMMSDHPVLVTTFVTAALLSVVIHGQVLPGTHGEPFSAGAASALDTEHMEDAPKAAAG